MFCERSQVESVTRAIFHFLLYTTWLCLTISSAFWKASVPVFLSSLKSPAGSFVCKCNRLILSEPAITIEFPNLSSIGKIDLLSIELFLINASVQYLNSTTSGIDSSIFSKSAVSDLTWIRSFRFLFVIKSTIPSTKKTNPRAPASTTFAFVRTASFDLVAINDL